MASKVTIRPTGREFTVEPKETILGAGLRHGVNLIHQCSNGTCGECRARLLSGRSERIRHHDFFFSAADRDAGWILMCCQRPLGDLTLEAVETDSAAEIPEQQLSVKVTRVEPLTASVTLLQVRTSRSQTLRFLAGQRARVELQSGVAEILPIASCPCDAMNLRFHVPAEPANPFRAHLLSELHKGDKVQLRGPYGSFVLDEASRRPLLFIVWEHGFAPVQSLIDHAISIDPERDIELHWLSRRAHGRYLTNYCRAWEDALDRFRFSGRDAADCEEPVFAPALEAVGQACRGLAQRDVYVSAPGCDQDALCRRLVAAGAASERLHFDMT